MRYRLLIIAATVIWGSSFVIMKDITDIISPAWILAARFSFAAMILAVVLSFKRERRALYLEKSHFGYGLLLGVAMFLAYYTQTIGITDTTPGKNAFLTGTYCVIVPFLAWIILRRRPNRYNLAAALLCIVGIGFISLDGGFSMRFGDAMTLVCAVFYALHIVLVSKFASGRDIYVLTMWQFAGVAICSLTVGALFEPAPIWGELPAECWASLAYLTIACTTLALLFQNIGQAHLPPSSASLLLSLEAVFGVAFSVALGAEQLTLRIVIGFALVFAAIVVSEVLPERLSENGMPKGPAV